VREPDERTPVALLVDDVPYPRLVDALAADALTVRIGPAPLSAAAVGALLAEVLGSEPAVPARLRALGEPAIAVARSTVVLGDRAELGDLAALARLAAPETKAARRALRGGGLFTPDRGSSHPLVGEAVARARRAAAAGRVLRGPSPPRP
jgi:hypothetical protein